MRVLIFLCLGGVLASAAALPSIADDFKVLESFDADSILNDPNKWKALYNCYMDLAPCGELQDFKDATVRMYTSKCEVCTEEQKKRFYGVIQMTVEKYPEECRAIMDKYPITTE